MPALLLYLGVVVGPAFYAVWISLHEWSGAGEPMKWVGIENFRELVGDPIFHRAFLNTLKVLVFVGCSVFFLSFLFTMILREIAGRRFIRAVLFFPNIVAPVAIAIAWGFLLSPDGLLNSSLRAAGLDALAKPWLGPDWRFNAIMAGLAWIYTGFYTTILMAASDRIPRMYYEDCDLAGANALQRFRHVTLPLMWDVVGVAAILWVITAFGIFEFIYAFGGAGRTGPVGNWTEALFIFAYSYGGNPPIYQLGYACAAAVTMMICVGLLIVGVRRLMRRAAVQY